MTQTEFDILRILLSQIGEVVPRQFIIDKLWKGQDGVAKSRTIDVHIRTIRKKIPELTRNLMSVYGKGYKFEV